MHLFSLVFTMKRNAGKTKSIAAIAHSTYHLDLPSYLMSVLCGEAVWELGVAFLLAPYGLQCNLAVGYRIEF